MRAMTNSVVVGIDEVGRGSWAGPLVVGAVILASPLAGLRDSKVLTKLQRERLALVIHEQAYAVGLGWVSAGELDVHGMTAALRLGAERALAALGTTWDAIVVDGSFNFLSHLPNATALVDADASMPAVSAASIVAKVARDQYMAVLAEQFPHYGFADHVGYGTARHAAALQQYGPCEQHRRSFAPIKRLVERP